ncbi:MAG TPA: DUF2950 domain-containing protein [Gemmatimonadales bacterium]|jgi:hypothetical protein
MRALTHLLELALLASTLAPLAACNRDVKQRRFASPEEAAAALTQAAEGFDRPALVEILGSESKSLIFSKDSVQDRQRAVSFASEARIQHRIELDSSGTVATLTVGPTDWPLPFPIVKDSSSWRFDAQAGAEEVLLRRIGQNELDAIQVCRGYVEAQRTYASTLHDGSEVNQYAQRIISTPGKHDGLAWKDSNGVWQGPVGESIARVIAEGYQSNLQPYHGYYFKILKGQGPAAPLGEMNFLTKGLMIGGFALAAAPAEYRVSGVKTFIVSHSGIVYEQDLGPKTLEQFKAMEVYNPDSTWTPVSN